MSRDVAVGVVIGGAVSSSLGVALGRVKQDVGALHRGMGDTKGLKNLIGETQRLQRELAQAEQAGRRVGLDAVRALRGEVAGLEKDWQANTARVAELARAHADARKLAAGAAGGDLDVLKQEHQQLEAAAKLAAAQYTVKQAAAKEAKASGEVPRDQVKRLQEEAKAARAASAEAKALARAKKEQLEAGDLAAQEVARLASQLDKAKKVAAATKQAFEDKRLTLQATRNELRQTVPVVGEVAAKTLRMGEAAGAAAKGQHGLRDAMQQSVPVVGAVASEAVQLGAAVRAASQSQGSLRDKLAANIRALRDAGVETGNLEGAMKRLQRAEQGMQWQSQGRTMMQSGVELGRTAGAVTIGAAAVPTVISGNYQDEVRDIAIKAGVADKPDEAVMSGRIAQAADDARMDRSALAAAVNGLVTQGMSWQQATGHGDLLAELIKGQRFAPEDAAKLIYSFGQNGVSPEAMRKTMGQLAVAGDLGAFEANAMAKFMPEMLATTGALGFQGPEAVRYLAASLQAQVKLTGDPDSAANNLKNLLAKITAPEIAKKFDDKGFDLQASMRAQMRQGKNPIEAFIALTESLAAGGNKAKQQQLQAMKERVRTSSNKGDEAAALDAYMKMAGLGDIITDMQARAAALAQIKYGKQITADLATIQQTDGGKKLQADKQSRDATSNAKWDAAKNSFNAAMVDIGDAIRPVTDGAAELSASMLSSASDMAKAHPGVALGAVAAGVLTIGAAAAKVSAGMLQWAGGKVLSGVGGKLPGAASGAPGVPGAAGKVLDALGGAAGVQKVFVVNMPGAGLPGLEGKPGAGKPGMVARVGAVASSVVGMGRTALAAPTLGAIAKGGGAVLGTSAAMVVGAGAAGYAAGAALNAGITAALSDDKHERTLGTWLYEKLHPEEVVRPLPPVAKPLPPVVAAAVVPSVVPVSPALPVAHAVVKPVATTGSPVAKPVAPVTVAVPPAVTVTVPPAVPPKPLVVTPKVARPAPPPVPNLTFNPVIQVKVMGDAKRPEEIAKQIAPHLRRLFDQWLASQRSKPASGMYDPVGG